MGTIQIKKVEKKVVTGKVGENRQKVTKVAVAKATAADSSREEIKRVDPTPTLPRGGGGTSRRGATFSLNS